MKIIFLICAAAMLFAVAANAQTRTQDSLAIIKTAHDYIDGYYTNDTTRMQGALHPELAKRIIAKNANGNEQLGQMGAMTLILNTKNHPPIPADKRRQDVTVTDIFRDAATAKVIASGWVDFLQLHRWHGRWVIVNVLWELEK
ncbi:MAG TPA: nuclear transport factor 2 family protein [Mucilaginibacter sp.]|jgi:hypothetical protein|nr:nuclear transport factor 2 family protein [Mucilaginibacter sp.]